MLRVVMGEGSKNAGVEMSAEEALLAGEGGLGWEVVPG